MKRQPLARGGAIFFVTAVAAGRFGADRLEQSAFGIRQHALKISALMNGRAGFRAIDIDRSDNIALPLHVSAAHRLLILGRAVVLSIAGISKIKRARNHCRSWSRGCNLSDATANSRARRSSRRTAAPASASITRFISGCKRSLGRASAGWRMDGMRVSQSIHCALGRLRVRFPQPRSFFNRVAASASHSRFLNAAVAACTDGKEPRRCVGQRMATIKRDPESPSGLIVRYWRCHCVAPLNGAELYRCIREMRQAIARRQQR